MNDARPFGDEHLRIPREWVERRLSQMNPGLTADAILRLEDERDSLANKESLLLPYHLAISFFPDGMEKIADRFNMSAFELTSAIVEDFTGGVAVFNPDQTRSYRPAEFRLVGTRWRVIVKPQRGKVSNIPLAVANIVQSLPVPTNQPLFAPASVSFCPIWDEIRGEVHEWLSSYQDLRAIEAARRDEERDVRARLSRLKEERRDAVRQTQYFLERAQLDQSITQRSRLHSQVRRRFSALRVLMDLLRIRAEKETYEYKAVIAEPVLSDEVESPEDQESAQAEDAVSNDGPFLRLQLVEQNSASVLGEDMLVELRFESRRRPTRARIRSMLPASLVEVDLPADYLPANAEVTIATVSRFGMRSHQRAVQNMLDERAEGHWPDLARLLTSPGELEPPAKTLSNDDQSADAQGPNLNVRQQKALAGALSTHHAFCIQGPPGTGKTTVICELIQRLVAKGERILLVAPTHVAVDEVLRRIGSRDSIRALRISWDDSKVADDVKKYMPANIIDPFLDRASIPDSERPRRWQAEVEALARALGALRVLREAQDRRQLTEEESINAASVFSAATHAFKSQEPLSLETIRTSEAAIAAATEDIRTLDESIGSISNTYDQTHRNANWFSKAVSLIGIGDLASLSRQKAQKKKEKTLAERKVADLQRTIRTEKKRIDDLVQQMKSAETISTAKENALRDARDSEKNAIDSCTSNPRIHGRPLDAAGIMQLSNELQLRMNRLAAYSHLAGTFNTLITEAKKKQQDLEGLRRELLTVTNLFCCTTTGVANSPELFDVSFDTLIVDEASRVTDSEFLIAANRAKRWILVGDEHQLPPYVEQNDEHFIHALSALHQSERSSIPLEESVDALGRLWEEDEELHRFRRDSVLRLAQEVARSGKWDADYRNQYVEGIEYLRTEVDDPSKALLQAMRESLVHSLFERVVGSCPDHLKVRLVLQRRMIEPIASIVSTPVYHGDYQTPHSDDLARHGITPLVTPTFPVPITFLDTSLLGVRARDELLGNSFVNRVEVRYIVEACRILDKELAQTGSSQVTVSILAFYKAQTRLIKEQLRRYRFAKLRFSVIDAIDRIQGQESDLVILSFVRTAGKNVSPTFGQWLQDLRRLNVACTRAHRALIFVGQRELLARLCANDESINFYRHLNALFDTRSDVMRVVRQFGGTQ